MKKFLMGAALAALMAGQALAANLPLVTGPVDPANQIQTLNQVIQSVNGGVDGNLAALPAAVTTSGTTLNNLLVYTAPGGLLASAGQTIHTKAWGTNSADANVKTVTLTFGTINCALVVTGSGNTWVADFYLTKTGANTQTYECQGQTATTLIASVQGTGTVTDTTAQSIAVQGTAATAGTITVAGAYVEQLK